MAAHPPRKHASARRPFSVEEDARLMEIMRNQEFVNWDNVATQMPERTCRQVRERWVNYLSPNIRNDPWTEHEDYLLLEKINEMGRSWSNIGHFFDGRSENDIKNRWYSHIKYRIRADVDGKFHFVTDPSQSLYPERKKRNRTKICPQKNAMRVLEQKSVTKPKQNVQLPPLPILGKGPIQLTPLPKGPLLPPLPMVTIPKQQSPQTTEEGATAIVDLFDRSLVDEYADAIVEQYDTAHVSLSNGFIFD